MTRTIRTLALPALALGLACTLPAQERGGRGGRPNLLFTTLDADHDNTISAAELSNAPAALRALDKNHDGKLTLDETRNPMGFGRGGEGGGRGPEGGERREGPGGPGSGADAVEEIVKNLMAFDANNDGKLQKSEVPERMQGIFERGDTNKDGILTPEELRDMARAQSQQSAARGRGGEREGEREGGRGGRGGFGMDPIFAALDANHDNEIDAAEIDHAAAALKSLDKNQDGVLTQDEVRPNFSGRGMPGRQ